MGGTDYNGWANWDTWNANLHLTNDYDTYKDVMHVCRMHEAEQAIPFLKEIAQHYTRVIRDGVEFPKVDWQEIYDTVRSGD